uniref:Uncharacterized protein n=1 Tax=Leersia perrieri TaxID=77586 RepID=A0A0D9WM90_9ORYZ
MKVERRRAYRIWRWQWIVGQWMWSSPADLVLPPPPLACNLRGRGSPPAAQLLLIRACLDAARPRPAPLLPRPASPPLPLSAS